MNMNCVEYEPYIKCTLVFFFFQIYAGEAAGMRRLIYSTEIRI